MTANEALMLAALRAILKEVGPLDPDPESPGSLGKIGRTATEALRAVASDSRPGEKAVQS